MIPANCIGTCTLNSGMWTGTGRNQEETFSPFSTMCQEVRLAASPVTDLKKVAKPGTRITPEFGLTGPHGPGPIKLPVSCLGLIAFLPYSPLEVHSCLH